MTDRREYMRIYMKKYRELNGSYTDVQKKAIKKYQQSHKKSKKRTINDDNVNNINNNDINDI